jgi:membrane protease YdiL (CAAX protease family)
VTPPFLRCPACGVINAGPVRECVACGTIIPGSAVEPNAMSDVPSEGVSGATENPELAGWRRVRGVAHIFIGSVAVAMGGIGAAKLGAGELRVDLAVTVVVAVVALTALAFGWKTLSPALRTTGGVRGLLTAGTGLVFIAGFAHVYFQALRWFGFPFVRYTDIYIQAGLPIWSAYLLIALAPAICEELVFRGYVSARLSELLSPNETLVVQAALFALLHLSPVIFPSHFLMGVVFGIVRRRSGSLYPSMLTHAAWNAYVVFSEAGM